MKPNCDLLKLTNHFRNSLFLQPSTTPSLPIIHPCIRDFSSAHTQQPAAPAQREQKIDPYALLDDDLKDIFEDVRQVSDKLFSLFLIITQTGITQINICFMKIAIK